MEKYITKNIVFEAESYREGLEDGFDYFLKTITDAELVYKLICKRMGEEKNIPPEPDDMRYYRKAPYLETERGKFYIRPDDIIVIGAKSKRYLLDKEEFDLIFKKL